MSNMDILNTLVIIGIIAAALATIFIEDLLSSVITVSIVAILMSVEFIILKAVDVALVEAVVGGIMLPIAFIVTLKKVQDIPQKSDSKQEGDK